MTMPLMPMMSAGAVGFLTNKILRRHVAVRHQVNLVAAHRPEGGKDHGVLDLLLRDHFFEAGEQIGAEFEAQHDNALQMAADGKHVGHIGAVGLGVDRRIAGGMADLAARLLRGQRQARGEEVQQRRAFSLEFSSTDDARGLQRGSKPSRLAGAAASSLVPRLLERNIVVGDFG